MASKKRAFRNVVDIYSDQQITVDEGALWHLEKNNRLILEDDDQYITTPYNHRFFREEI